MASCEEEDDEHNLDHGQDGDRSKPEHPLARSEEVSRPTSRRGGGAAGLFIKVKLITGTEASSLLLLGRLYLFINVLNVLSDQFTESAIHLSASYFCCV